jgi:MATE family multidrug resistance protein
MSFHLPSRHSLTLQPKSQRSSRRNSMVVVHTAHYETEGELADISISVTLKNLLPNFASSIMYMMMMLIEIPFLGNSEHTSLLTGVHLGLLYSNIFVMYVGYGLTEAMSVVCSQSFGEKDLRKLGIQTNQMKIFVTTLFVIYFVFTLMFGNLILELIGAGEHEFVDISKRFIYYNMPAIIIDLYVNIYFKYLETQLCYSPVIMSIGLACGIHLINCVVFIQYFALEELGVGIANTLTEASKLIYLLYWCQFKNPYPDSNFWIDKDCFDWDSMKSLLKASLFSMITVYAEYCGYSFSNIFAARLDELSYAKYIVLSYIFGITYSLAYATLNTTSIMVGNYVGQNSPENIEKSKYYIPGTAYLIQAPMLLIFLIFHKWIVEFFCANTEVNSSPDISMLFMMCCFYELFDLSQCLLQGYLRGLGILNQTTIYTFINFLVFLPLNCYIFVYVLEWGLPGIFFSELLAYSGLTFVFLYVLKNKVDIHKICHDYHNGANTLI